MTLLAGTRLGPYEILAPIGAGGMGEVYKARDTRLGREVAVKVLPAEFARDAERLRRFEQEARATAALDHPNILAIHDIGTHEGTPYIVEQLLEGESLRQRLRGGPLTPAKAVEFGVQIASGLAAAHEKGIVHRDLKPENLFVTKDGRIKILDFGLARLRLQEGPPEEGRSGAATADSPTREGRILGTPGYMSPEQVRGRPVDARTDIFAFGVVLYEMLSGNRAFAGDTAADTQAAILTRDPDPLPAVTPATLDQIVRRCLEKRPEDRFSSAHDLRLALEAVSGAAAAVSTPASVAPAVVPRRRARVAAAGMGIILLAAALFTLLYLRREKAPPATRPFEHMKVARLTRDGKADMPVISPDGRYVAYIRYDEKSRQSLCLQQVNTAIVVQLVPPTEGEFTGLAFSPDGDYVYYGLYVQSRASRLYRIPVLGGPPEVQPVEDIDTAVTFSPDGKQIAFVRGNDKSPMPAELWTVNLDGTGQKLVTANRRLVTPSWSPDGSTIAWGISEGGQQVLQLVDARTGTTRPLGSRRWDRIRDVRWMPDGQSLLLIALDLNVAPDSQLWSVDYPAGNARPVTSDIGGYRRIGVSADGRSLVSLRIEHRIAIWTAPLDDVAHPVRFSQDLGSIDGGNALAWTPAGGLVYSSIAGGSPDLWIVEKPGDQPRRLTHDPLDEYDANVSPDGRIIVFAPDRKSICRVNADGGARTELAAGKWLSHPMVTADGRWVLYADWDKKEEFRVPIEGGTPAPLGDGDPFKTKNLEGFTALALSPDGRNLGGYFRDERGMLCLSTVPLDGSRAPGVLAAYPSTGGEAAWSPDGRSLLYQVTLGNGMPPLITWKKALDKSPPEELIERKGEEFYNIAVWNQGRQVAYSAGTFPSDVVLIQDTGGLEDTKR